MPETISPEVEQLVRKHIDGEQFASTNDVLLVAMQLFNEFQARYRDELGVAIKRGFDQIDRGEGIKLRDESALRNFFDDIKRRGRQRYEASKSG